MHDVAEIRGSHEGTGRRFGLVASSFNQSYVERLLEGALECLVSHGVASGDIEVVRVPGAWEIGQALEVMAQSTSYDALIALGVVIRGETPHFDYICAECSRAVGEVARRRGLPVTFGVLTCDDADQAAARSGGRAGNKGTEAALAALEMVSVMERLAGRGSAVAGEEA